MCSIFTYWSSTNHLLLTGPCRKAPVTKEFCTDHYWYGPNKCSPEYCRWVFNHIGLLQFQASGGEIPPVAVQKDLQVGKTLPPKKLDPPPTACATRTLTRSRWTRSAIPSWAPKSEQSTNQSQGKTANQRSQEARRRRRGRDRGKIVEK